MIIKNIKDLKEFIKEMPDDMPVQSCCDCGGGTSAHIMEEEVFDENCEHIGQRDFVWIGYN